MTMTRWMMIGGLLAACTVRAPEASQVPAAQEEVTQTTEPPAAAPDAVMAAQEAPKAAPPAPTSPLTDTFFVVHTRASDTTYKVYGTELAPKHTLITAAGFAHATLRSTGAEEVTFETNFVEPSEDPAENQYIQTVPFGLYEVDTALGSGRGVSTPGHVHIDRATGLNFSPIAFDAAHADYAMFMKVMHDPDIESVLQWDALRHVKTGYCHHLFHNKTKILSNCPDYATGDIRLDLYFESGGTRYVAGDAPAKGRRNENYVLAGTGDTWKTIEPTCVQCSQ